MSVLQVGALAPAFTLLDQDGVEQSLKDYKGSWVLLYFYPKDDTPGCTTEACTFRDALPSFSTVDAVVLGISKDSVSSHKKFAEKYALPFRLLADTEHVVISEYGFWQPKKFMGREFLGTVRSSVLLAPDGSIAKIYENVKAAEHAALVLADLQQLRAKE
ncbi:MAG: thioredoxin-dependent thiol peroxidase [Patescibacteria group bacterium]|jgi:peroxiredoxin Q/BCP